VQHGPGFFGGSAWCDATTVTIVSMDERLGQHKWNAGRAPVEETGLQALIDEHRARQTAR